MSDTDKALFNIEAFIRSEGVSSDIIVMDKIIIANNFSDQDKAAKINELVSTIKSRKPARG
ncbi:hypothetical protein SJI19_16955 [Acerihabitans sp. TG2]|uniref:hypothetical protein n=1 Tax=Acerihabitans sp. TG2 TaxID=3096008 RepID=UPI002B231D76|nr:hypothetical protein [Acerihabitans sp. TG2]MEA9392216.1 hypothetical protein [Acerihabitans sp. TG2]